MMFMELISSASLVGIATGYGLDGQGIESRSGDLIPVGARFSAPVQTGPEAYPASCTMDIGYFQLRRDADPSPPSSAVV
jgi:hypothetical protein